jgi:hypothetical protein
MHCLAVTRLTRPLWLHPVFGLLASLIVVMGIANVVWGVIEPGWLGNRDFLVIHVLAIIAFGYLGIAWILPLAFGRERPDTMQRVGWVQASGPMLASARCSARVGMLSFRGPLLHVSVYPGGIVLQPLLMPSRAILTSELREVDDVPPVMGWFGPASVSIKHTAPDVRASVRLHIGRESQLAAAIRSLRPEDDASAASSRPVA